MLYEQHKEFNKDLYGKHEGFEGKAREHWHPFDRKSGTGRGKELPKGGHGKANWGDIKDELQMFGELSVKSTGPVTEVQAPNKNIETIPEDEQLDQYDPKKYMKQAKAEEEEEEIYKLISQGSKPIQKQEPKAQKLELSNDKEFPSLS